MSTPRDAVARTWYFVLAVLVAIALVTQIVLIVQGGPDVNTGEAGPLAPVGTRLVRLFSFFTIQSNLLVLALAVGLALDPARDGRGFRVLQLDALLGITVTGVVFAALLSSVVTVTGVAWAVDLVFHRIAPVAVLAGWLVFGPRPRIDGRTVAWACVWPVAWLVYTFVRGALVDWYPYPFLDLRVIDAGTAATTVGGVVAGAVLLALLLWWADRRLSRSSSHPVRSDVG
ncbi:Integral membrane protein [Pseudonocardia sp. Ae168_Ps1]|uniref:Pr6Pr family membrane protein n=1 Tax=unclassified Pseudonocardia TaxID=2619320 RepID=UPI00094B78C6|nr:MULTISPECIES: Pr6Pr family membrane protein [unclassified Pseudonocardia]OLL70999.1 Integral membrane protein [Pseudonocardia sp. Ae168_Ps1]OLL77451.1 Integral membrane protein [Pseudonocardia sp. Ae150A_Ps1]OLL88437.1 Integral membrane protein [Pseudonocardia sp. Ae263_Ps1]OLL91540.1 Integral membrane protein [Pseudonocardia sp. Ae356_Ps1]